MASAAPEDEAAAVEGGPNSNRRRRFVADCTVGRLWLCVTAVAVSLSMAAVRVEATCHFTIDGQSPQSFDCSPLLLSKTVSSAEAVTGSLIAFRDCNIGGTDLTGRIALIPPNSCPPRDVADRVTAANGVGCILISDYATAGIVVYTQFEYGDRPVNAPVITAAQLQLQPALDLLAANSSAVVMATVSSDGGNPFRDAFESWWASTLLIGLGLIAILNIAVAAYKMHQLRRAAGCGFTIAHVSLSIHILTNVLRLNVFMLPMCLCRNRLLGFLLNSLPVALTLIATILLIFYFLELTSKNISKPARFLRTAQAQSLFVLCSLLLIGFDITFDCLGALYIGRPAIVLTIYGGAAAVVLCVVAVVYVVMARRLIALREQGRRMLGSQAKHERDPSVNAIFAAVNMILLTVTLAMVAFTNWIQFPVYNFLLLQGGRYFEFLTSFFQIRVFATAKPAEDEPPSVHMEPTMKTGATVAVTGLGSTPVERGLATTKSGHKFFHHKSTAALHSAQAHAAYLRAQKDLQSKGDGGGAPSSARGGGGGGLNTPKDGGDATTMRTHTNTGMPSEVAVSTSYPLHTSVKTISVGARSPLHMNGPASSASPGVGPASAGGMSVIQSEHEPLHDSDGVLRDRDADVVMDIDAADEGALHELNDGGGHGGGGHVSGRDGSGAGGGPPTTASASAVGSSLVSSVSPGAGGGYFGGKYHSHPPPPLTISTDGGALAAAGIGNGFASTSAKRPPLSPAGPFISLAPTPLLTGALPTATVTPLMAGAPVPGSTSVEGSPRHAHMLTAKPSAGASSVRASTREPADVQIGVGERGATPPARLKPATAAWT